MADHYEPRRVAPDSAPPERKFNWRWLVAGGVALALAGGGAVLALTRNTEAAGTCAESATLVVDPDYRALGQRLADRYSEQAPGDCDLIQVTGQASHEVAKKGLGEADAWLPEDITWAQRASGEGAALAAATPTTFAHTPLVLAYERQLREALGDQRQNGPLLVDLLTENKRYDAFGKPWGVIKLVEPDPNTSAVGAMGFMTMAMMLSNGEPPPTDPVKVTDNQLRMAAAEHRVVQRVPTSADVLGHLAANPADDTARGPAGPRTGLTTEYTVLTQVREGANVVAEHLGDGATGVQLGIVNPTGNATVQGFVDWLASPQGVAELNELGLRTTDSGPEAEALSAAGLSANPLPPLRPNDTAQVMGATALQAGFAQRSSVLPLLDLSGSMATPFGNTGLRRVDVVSQAALSSWAAWPPGYSTGLMTFHADAEGNPLIQPVFPLEDNRSPVWKEMMPHFHQGMESLKPEGGTPLYLAISQAYQYNLQTYQPGKPNKIVVLTDGVDEFHNAKFTADDLINQLKNEADPKRPIEMFYVLIGPEAGYPEVSRVAEATGGKAIWVRDLAELPTVMRSLLAGL
ncbi:MAG: substrate-binding domain-containing protein [Propionibacteriaceae bacterium]|nr:substrate-binding domain-containing protein [Propionibacteriaceae bacterium]